MPRPKKHPTAPATGAPPPLWMKRLDRRLHRAEKLLDVWMDRYEANLPQAEPDASKIGELVNFFTLLKRILEIHEAQQKLLLLQQTVETESDPFTAFALPPHLLGLGGAPQPGGEDE
ncbi:MAG: hypothetical protein SFY68_09925 [Candidatus Sumerlaeia bacterium]|nr:hypothetical protein [Candidatus Sumerlaeia bacterium]